MRLQYSVFVCDMSALEFSRWHAEIYDHMALTIDSVVHVDLGALGADSPIRSIGVPRAVPPASGATIL